MDILYNEISGGSSNFTLLSQYQDEVGSNIFGLGLSYDFKFMSFFAFNTGAVQTIFIYLNINYTMIIINNEDKNN